MISSHNTEHKILVQPSMEHQSSLTTPLDEGQLDMSQLAEKWEVATTEQREIPAFLEHLKSTDMEKQCSALVTIRKLLSIKKNPPIQEILDLRVVPIFTELLLSSKDSQISLEAARCLASLCLGTSKQVKELLDCEIVPCFIYALDSQNGYLVEQCMRGLGIIAGDSVNFRDFVISDGAIETIVKVFTNTSGLSLKQNGTWTLANCCKGKPAPSFDSISAAIPWFCSVLKNEVDIEILVDAAWGLSYISCGHEGIETVLGCDIAAALVRHLANPEIRLVEACLKVIGNIVSGNDVHTSVILKEEDLLPFLLSLSAHTEKSIRKEVFWIISNITAGLLVQFEGIMGNPAFVDRIIETAKNDTEEVRNEAIFALCNSVSNGTPAQMIRLLENGVYKCLIELLSELKGAKMLGQVLEGIENCLNWGKRNNFVDDNNLNKFVVELKEQGGLEKIESLQQHLSNDVYERALRILETYFENPVDDDQLTEKVHF